MDVFCEYIVKCKKTTKDYFIMAGVYLAAFILSVLLLLFSNYTYGLWLVLIAGVWYGAYFVVKTRYIEYEYALNNNELDIDKIMGKTRRKRMITVDFKQIEICAAINDEMYKSEYNTKSVAKTYNYSGESEYEKYFVDFVTQEGKVRVLFNPTDKMKENMSIINPRLVHIR